MKLTKSKLRSKYLKELHKRLEIYIPDYFHIKRIHLSKNRQKQKLPIDNDFTIIVILIMKYRFIGII